MPSQHNSFFQRELERLYSQDSLRPEQYQQVRQAKAYMERCYGDKIALNDLAKAAFMSRFHFVRIFQKIYGLTPRHYLRDLRISKAKQLIKDGKPITRVCLEVGYESLPTFSSAFKKCTGYSPRQYFQLHNSNLE